MKMRPRILAALAAMAGAGDCWCTTALGGLEVAALGKRYDPDPDRVAIMQREANPGGNTSVRNTAREHLSWKQAGYFARNRDLGQVFAAEEDFVLDAIVLRTGPADAAVLDGTAGAKVFVQFFEVVGEPRIDDNGTPPGTDATHGFSTNHRCDDFLEGVEYRPIAVVSGGTFPSIPATRDADGMPVPGEAGEAGRLVYLRWSLTGEDRLRCEAGRRYAFMVGLEEPGPGLGFTLANLNNASRADPPALADEHDRYPGGWGLRREGDGTAPPTMISGDRPPEDRSTREALHAEALFASGMDRYALSPTTDGYPDVDTYRDHEFYLEVTRSPSTGPR